MRWWSVWNTNRTYPGRLHSEDREEKESGHAATSGSQCVSFYTLSICKRNLSSSFADREFTSGSSIWWSLVAGRVWNESGRTLLVLLIIVSKWNRRWFAERFIRDIHLESNEGCCGGCSGLQVTEALRLQLEVQKRLHEQLEVCCKIAIRMSVVC